MSRVVHVLCEGYEDRDFLAGWLETLGHADARTHVHPKTGKKVTGSGAYALQSPEAFVVVLPSGGHTKIVDAARIWLNEADPARRPDSVLVVEDSDELAPGRSSQRLASHLQTLRDQYPAACVLASENASPSAGSILLDGWAWYTDAAPETRGLHDKQTLERLVCGAFLDVEPKRGDAVHAWLHSTPPSGVPKPDEKNHYFAYLSKYTDATSELAPYRRIWKDERARQFLEQQLRATGAEAVLLRALSGTR